MIEPLLSPDWAAPPRVRALMTTRAFGNVKDPSVKAKLRALLPGDPAWLRQVHGTAVFDNRAPASAPPEADASVARSAGAVCAVMAADCMPVLLADEAGTVVAAAHAGWRGLCAGVIESALAAMRVPPQGVVAWLGPAIGPSAYEVGDDVRDAFIRRDAVAAAAFASHGAGHWLLDLYAEASRRLAACGVSRIQGGGYCTFSEKERFFSFRRDQSAERMAALIWLT